MGGAFGYTLQMEKNCLSLLNVASFCLSFFSTTQASSSTADWQTIKKYLDPNPQLRGIEKGRYAPKVCMESLMCQHAAWYGHSCVLLSGVACKVEHKTGNCKIVGNLF